MEFNEFLRTACDRIGDKNFLSVLIWDESSKQSSMAEVNGRQFFQRTSEAAARLHLSLGPERKIMILSENSVELLVYFVAALRLGAKVCILDYKLTEREQEHIVDDFQPETLLVDEKKWGSSKQFEAVQKHMVKLIKIQELAKIPSGLALDSGENSKYDETNPQILVYTSGTSGKPKGVVLNASSLIFESQAIQASFERDLSHRISLSILPMNHIYGKFIFFHSLWLDQELILTQSLLPAHLRDLIKERRPNYLWVVPLFLSLIKNRVLEEIEKKPWLMKKVATEALKLNRFLKNQAIAESLFSEVREKIGSSVEFIISGGAPLPEDVFDFFEAIKIPVCNGYGLSETGPVISSNDLTFRRRGSVGRVLKGVQVKFDPRDGEILVKGPNVFKGYYQMPEASAEAFTEDGWFRTGDLGFQDKDGFIFFKGRSKNMIVLPSGKKVQPEEVENHFSELPFVKNCCFIYGGHGKTERKLHLVVELGEGSSESDDPLLLQELKAHAESLSPYKRPQNYLLRRIPLPMTTTQKVKRFLVQKEIDDGN